MLDATIGEGLRFSLTRLLETQFEEGSFAALRMTFFYGG